MKEEMTLAVLSTFATTVLWMGRGVYVGIVSRYFGIPFLTMFAVFAGYHVISNVLTRVLEDLGQYFGAQVKK